MPRFLTWAPDASRDGEVEDRRLRAENAGRRLIRGALKWSHLLEGMIQLTNQSQKDGHLTPRATAPSSKNRYRGISKTMDENPQIVRHHRLIARPRAQNSTQTAIASGLTTLRCFRSTINFIIIKEYDFSDVISLVPSGC